MFGSVKMCILLLQPLTVGTNRLAADWQRTDVKARGQILASASASETVASALKVWPQHKIT